MKMGSFMIVIFTLAVGLSLGDRSLELCKYEKSNATCKDDEVIVMTSSWYGRMHKTRCIKQDFGYVGVCFKNVLAITHRKCSGKQNCQLGMPNEQMENAPWKNTNPCPEDLSKYLVVNYTCQKVVKPKPKCNSGELVLSGRGNISSYVSRKTHCGSPDAPFVIQGKDGQQIKIGLIDYGSESMDLSIGDTVALSHKGEPPNCHHLPVYAILRDTVTIESRTVCGGRGVIGKLMDVFLSKGHKIEVRIQGRDDDNAREFLLSYEVIGCPDLPIGPHGTWKRHGDKATFKCTDNSKEYTIKCDGRKWTGQYLNCSTLLINPEQGAVLSTDSTSYGIFNMTLEIAIALVCSIAFVVGIFIVVVGMFIIRKRQVADARRRLAQYYQHPVCSGTLSKDGPHPHNPVHKMTMASRDDPQTPNIMYSRQTSQGREHHEHDYAYVDEHVISGINRPFGTPRVVVPPPLPAHSSFGMPPPPLNENIIGQQIIGQQDSVSLPDFEYLAQGYNTLDSRNFSALERESKRNRAHLEDNNNENRYS